MSAGGKAASLWNGLSQPSRMQLFIFAGYPFPGWVGGNPTITSVRALRRRKILAWDKEGNLQLTRLGRLVANHGRDLTTDEGSLIK